MTSDKASIGLVVLRSAEYSTAGFNDLRKVCDDDIVTIENSLGKLFDLCKTWRIATVEDLGFFRSALQECEPDLLIVIFQSKDAQTLLPGLIQESRGYPFVAWNYLPWKRIPRPIPCHELFRSIGASEMMDSFSVLHDTQQPFLYAYGSADDPALREKFLRFGEAARVVRELKLARFGFVGEDRQMQASTEFGSSVRFFSSADLQREVESIGQAEISEYLHWLTEITPVGDVPYEAVKRSAGLTMGLERLALQHHFHLVGVNDRPDWLMGSRFEARPTLPPRGTFSDSRILYQPTDDIPAGLANFILARLGKQHPLYLSIWTWDQARNTVICGHSGIQPLTSAFLGTGRIGRDFEWDQYADGMSAQLEFVARPGRVTLLQLRESPRGWRAIAATGMCLESEVWVKGLPHAIIRLDCHVDRFLGELARIGSSNHWVMAYASVVPELQSVSELLGIQLEILQ